MISNSFGFIDCRLHSWEPEFIFSHCYSDCLRDREFWRMQIQESGSLLIFMCEGQNFGILV